jgi:ketosteroid isomerase-like protein
MDESAIAQEILALETAALDRWGKGDPDGFLAISAAGVSYFDPFQERRVDGLPALKSLYETIRGKIKIDRAEIINPRVQVMGDSAILTFQFSSQGSEGSKLWNCTEGYQRLDGHWRIVHSHWSFAP